MLKTYEPINPVILLQLYYETSLKIIFSEESSSKSELLNLDDEYDYEEEDFEADYYDESVLQLLRNRQYKLFEFEKCLR